MEKQKKEGQREEEDNREREREKERTNYFHSVPMYRCVINLRKTAQIYRVQK